MRFAILSLALSAVCVPAAATDAGTDSITLRIEYSDLDLSDAQDRAMLESRVNEQLRDACTLDARSRYTFGRTIVDERCVADGRRAAFAKVERALAEQSRSASGVAAN